MKALYDFYPKFGDTTSATFIYSGSSPTYFTKDNLFYKEPVRSFKTSGTSSFTITLDLKTIKEIDTVFLNRINFPNYTLHYSTNNSTWVAFGSINGLKIDELGDEENYMHNIHVLSVPQMMRYIKLTVPANIALFESSYYKIGNFVAGKSVDILDPKNGFQIKYIPTMNINTFKSGYIEREKLGRTRRSFSGDFDKLNTEVLAKFRLTYRPFIIYFTHTGKSTDCYLVMNTTEMSQTFDFAKVKSMNFTMEEIV